jgi:flagellar biosynthesis GTPase FlhF
MSDDFDHAGVLRGHRRLIQNALRTEAAEAANFVPIIVAPVVVKEEEVKVKEEAEAEPPRAYQALSPEEEVEEDEEDEKREERKKREEERKEREEEKEEEGGAYMQVRVQGVPAQVFVKAPTIQIFAKILTGQTVSLDVDPSDSVSVLRHKIQNKMDLTDVQVDHLSLVVSGTVSVSTIVNV